MKKCAWGLFLILLAGCGRGGPANGAASGDNADVLGALGDARQGFSTAITDVQTVQYVIQSGLVNALYAKEICSCTFVAQLDQATCFDRARISVSDYVVEPHIDEAQHRVSADGIVTGKIFPDGQSPINPGFVAAFDPARPQLGCRIVQKSGG